MKPLNRLKNHCWTLDVLETLSFNLTGRIKEKTFQDNSNHMYVCFTWACLAEGFNALASAVDKQVYPVCWLISGFKSPWRQLSCALVVMIFSRTMFPSSEKLELISVLFVSILYHDKIQYCFCTCFVICALILSNEKPSRVANTPIDWKVDDKTVVCLCKSIMINDDGKQICCVFHKELVLI